MKIPSTVIRLNQLQVEEKNMLPYTHAYHIYICHVLSSSSSDLLADINLVIDQDVNALLYIRCVYMMIQCMDIFSTAG